MCKACWMQSRCEKPVPDVIKELSLTIHTHPDQTIYYHWVDIEKEKPEHGDLCIVMKTYYSNTNEAEGKTWDMTYYDEDVGFLGAAVDIVLGPTPVFKWAKVRKQPLSTIDDRKPQC